MAHRYYTRPASPPRAASPKGRQTAIPERSSTGGFGPPPDAYYSRYRDEYASPRSSNERVVPSASQNYIAPSSATTARPPGYDAYGSKHSRRRSTLTEADTRRPADLAAYSRSRPIIHSELHRPSSPLARTYDDRDTHITPAVAPRREHKKVYSVDEGQTKLIDERDVNPRRRDSADKGYRGSRSYKQKGYHLNGPAEKSRTEDYYSYTDAAGMYRDTEPRWRRRRGSVEGQSRRPTSMLIEPSNGPRTREPGPPPTTRGLERLSGAMERTNSTKYHGRPGRDRGDYGAYSSDTETYAPPRRAATAHQPGAAPQERHDRYKPRENTHDERRDGRLRDSRYDDPDVASRGAGIRSGSVDRHGSARGGNFENDRALAYSGEPLVRIPSARDYLPSEEARRDVEPQDRERAKDRDHQYERNRDREDRGQERPRHYERARDREDRDQDRDPIRDRNKDHDHRRDREREHERDRHERGAEERSSMSAVAPAAITAGVAYGAGEVINSRGRDNHHDEREDRSRRQKRLSSESVDNRERHYVGKDDARESGGYKNDGPNVTQGMSADEEYRRRVQQELERSGKPSRDARDRESSNSDEDREKRQEGRSSRSFGRRREPDHAGDSDSSHGSRLSEQDDSRALVRPEKLSERNDNLFAGAMVNEPGDIAEPAERENRVRIVTPPKEVPPAPKGILRKPTQKFPEHPNPIREGVAPLKDAKRGKDIPPGARWTKIDRRLVNPEALEEAKERFEERMDCVIVLRVLTKEEIQKFADRTAELRQKRGNDSFSFIQFHITGLGANHDFFETSLECRG